MLKKIKKQNSVPLMFFKILDFFFQIISTNQFYPPKCENWNEQKEKIQEKARSENNYKLRREQKPGVEASFMFLLPKFSSVGMIQMLESTGEVIQEVELPFLSGNVQIGMTLQILPEHVQECWSWVNTLRDKTTLALREHHRV